MAMIVKLQVNRPLKYVISDPLNAATAYHFHDSRNGFRYTACSVSNLCLPLILVLFICPLSSFQFYEGKRNYSPSCSLACTSVCVFCVLLTLFEQVRRLSLSVSFQN
jgi:hypothetical protein